MHLSWRHKNLKYFIIYCFLWTSRTAAIQFLFIVSIIMSCNSMNNHYIIHKFFRRSSIVYLLSIIFPLKYFADSRNFDRLWGIKIFFFLCFKNSHRMLHIFCRIMSKSEHIMIYFFLKVSQIEIKFRKALKKVESL